ncbi:hypothetical protein [Chitinophaga sp.]|uniref:hypothetical protein n=1 Tax=Chitinophaga sp. TaxID=1869181 RepID=UPI002F950551
MKYLAFILFIGLTACHSSPSKQPITVTNTRDSISNPDLHRLLSLYNDINADTLEVASQTGEDVSAWKYSGTLIDTALLPLLPAVLRVYEPFFYACYKFDLDTNTIGLITRTPSEYESSSIKLFALHKKTNTITFETELADSWGDAGDAVNISSWLYRNKESRWMGILEKSNYSEDLEDTTAPISETYDYYHFKWNGNRIDTISTDSSTLVAVYKQISPEKKK